MHVKLVGLDQMYHVRRALDKLEGVPMKDRRWLCPRVPYFQVECVIILSATSLGKCNGGRVSRKKSTTSSSVVGAVSSAFSRLRPFAHARDAGEDEKVRDG